MSLLVLLSLASAQQADVPAGSFSRGSGATPDETPRRDITLSAYRIDLHEVTVGEFERFVAEGYDEQSHWSAPGWSWQQANPASERTDLRAADRTDDHPVVGVSWYEADAYCRWKGGSLPTEAQWERASCGEGRFAWGDDEEVDAVWYSGSKYGHITGVMTDPAASADPSLASPMGLLHTAGNVWEWTADWYHRAAYETGPDTDPTGPATGTWKTMRGGSFMNLPSYCTCTHREPARPDRVSLTVGFRCAYSSP